MKRRLIPRAAIAAPVIASPSAKPIPLDFVVLGIAAADADGDSKGEAVVASIVGVGAAVAEGDGAVTDTALDGRGTAVGVAGPRVGAGAAVAAARTTTVPRIPSAAHELSGQ